MKRAVFHFAPIHVAIVCLLSVRSLAYRFQAEANDEDASDISSEREQLNGEASALESNLASLQVAEDVPSPAPVPKREQRRPRSLRQELSAMQQTLSDDSSTSDDSSASAASDAQEQAQASDATTQLDKEDEDEGHVAASDNIAARPHNGGDADIVQFGIYEKTFFGIDMKDFTFTMDTVMTLKWSDPRTKDLVPDGASKLTLSAKDALKKIWMPEVVVTNREIRKFELISTSVTVYADGNVTKVERSLAMMKNKWDLTAFPFDTQVLATRVASSKYMLNEVKLQPIEGGAVSGVNDGLFDDMGYIYKKFALTEFEEIDGALQKSRGLLEVTVEREPEKYFQNHLLPSCLMLAISCGVFWFPFQQPFITPRLALSILALLSFVTLSRKVDSMLPAAAPFCWNDLYNMNCIFLMFFAIICNIVTEIVFHQLGKHKLGVKMNNELKIVWPLLAIISFTSVFSNTSGKKLGGQALASLIILIGGFLSYIAFCFARVPMQAEESEPAK